jgi:CcmD family protein
VMLATALAEVPALPLHTAGKYVAGAYVVLFVLVLVYVAIMAVRLSHIEGELGKLLQLVDASSPEGEGEDEGEPAEERQRESTPAYPVKGHT